MKVPLRLDLKALAKVLMLLVSVTMMTKRMTTKMNAREMTVKLLKNAKETSVPTKMHVKEMTAHQRKLKTMTMHVKEMTAHQRKTVLMKMTLVKTRTLLMKMTQKLRMSQTPMMMMHS